MVAVTPCDAGGVVAHFPHKRVQPAAIEPEVFDKSSYEELASILQPMRLAIYLDALEVTMNVVPGSDTDRGAIADRAHKLISLAGMLGFSKLASLAAQLEFRCRENAGLDEILLQLQTGKTEVASRLGVLRMVA